MEAARPSPRKSDINPLDKCLPFTFDLPPDHLVFVNSPAQFGTVRNFLETTQLMGIDTETRPSFVSGCKNPTALLQISMRAESMDERVFVFDLLAILPQYAQEFNDLLEPSWSSNHILKLGQGLNQDMRELSAAYPLVPCFKNVQSILETNALSRLIEPQQKHLQGLKRLTQTYLNYNLVKSQQMSNWAKRPLTQSQLHYAACDALILIRLYDAMSMEIKDIYGEYDFRSICVSYVRQPNAKKNSPRKRKAATPEEMTTNSEASDGTTSEAESDSLKRTRSSV